MTFPQFLESLDGDSHRPSLLGMMVGAGLLMVWSGWFLLARISVYEVTDRARLEADRAIHPIQALVAGRVIRASLAVGREVHAGDVLVELDAEPERLLFQEQRARLDALVPRVASLRAEIAAEQRAVASSREATRASKAEMRAQFEEADAAAGFAELEAQRLQLLRQDGLLSEMELLRARTGSEQKRAAARQRLMNVERLERDQQVQEDDRRVRVERLIRDIADLEGERATTAAVMERLRNEIDRRRILAPLPGTLGEAAVLRAGAVVREGDQLGAIVPAGSLRAIAEFTPARALGRIRPGCPGRLRLEGFPWFQYGSIPVVVSAVAGEIRDGSVRVELDVLPFAPSAIAMQHGLPGSIEIEVEQVTPAILVLRAAGRAFVRSPIRVRSAAERSDGDDASSEVGR